MRDPQWVCPNGHRPGDRSLRVGRDGQPICPICTAEPASHAFVYAAIYAGVAALFGFAAWKTSAIISVLAAIVGVLLAAVALWTAAFTGGLLLLIGWAKRRSGDTDLK
jgi:hypothetical protein